jgi:hypothetical protein
MLLSNRMPAAVATNVAVMAFGAFIVTIAGFAVPVAAPDHPLN